MRIIIVLLSGLLALSVTLNIYFYAQMTLGNFALEQEDVRIQKAKVQSPVNTTNKLNAPSPLEIAFNDFDFESALNLYEQQLIQNPELAGNVRQFWFERLLSAINKAQKSQSDHPYSIFISDYLKRWPYDSEFLYLELLDNQDNEEPVDLLAAFYTLRQSNASEELARLIDSNIKHNLDNLVSQLSELEAWDILAASLETLMPYDLNNRELLVNLAFAYAQSGQFGLMENVFTYLPQQDVEIARLRQFRDKQLAEEEVASTAESGIPLDKIGDHFLVNALIQEQFEAFLMIDTGASTTVISRSLFRSISRNIDTEYLGRYKMNTANGMVVAPVYRFKSLSIQGYKVNDIAMVVLPLADLQADGLLGMNFLRAFRFLIDQDEASLHLFARS